LVSVAVLGGSPQIAAQKTDLAALRLRLENFRENVRLASKVIDQASLRVFADEKPQDLVAFGLVNTLIKSQPTFDSYDSSIIPAINAPLKSLLLEQIAAGCGSPGPKPINDPASMTKIRATVVPNFYNKMLLLIASERKFVNFATINIQTELKAGQLFYFPLLKEPFDDSVKKLPLDVQNLLSSFLLK
jgi:hypothetical protein